MVTEGPGSFAVGTPIPPSDVSFLVKRGIGNNIKREEKSKAFIKGSVAGRMDIGFVNTWRARLHDLKDLGNLR